MLRIILKIFLSAIEEYDAEASFGVILNANNGEIIALASLPNFDPKVNQIHNLKLLIKDLIGHYKVAMS